MEEGRNRLKKKVVSKETLRIGAPLGVGGPRVEGGISYARKLAANLGNGTKDKVEKEIDREKRKLSDFVCTGEEGDWLKGTFTARLKEDFLWKYHGEDLQNECLRKLKVINMGDRMVLIRSESENSTERVIRDFEEWANCWFDWCRPWRCSDVNQRHLVWTKWLGVPLQAWR